MKLDLVIFATAFFMNSPALLQAQSKDEPKPDWERMKACAAQAEKVMRRPLMRDEQLVGSHYSPKYGRCFMVTSNQKDGFWTTTISDAFEGAQLAVDFLSMPKGMNPDYFCSIWDPTARETNGAHIDESVEIHRNCLRVRAYIDERMNH